MNTNFVNNPILVRLLARCLETRVLTNDGDIDTLLDAIWLVHCGFGLDDNSIASGDEEIADTDSPNLDQSEGGDADETVQEIENAEKPPEEIQPNKTTQPFGLHVPFDSSSELRRGTRIHILSPSALPDERGFDHSLRPLRAPTRRTVTEMLDEAATVDRIASTLGTAWTLMFQFSRERTRNLVCILDRSPTMRFWHSTLERFQKVLWRSGAFQHIQIAYVDSFSSTPCLCSDAGLTRSVSIEHLCRVSDRELVLFFTDFRSDPWLAESTVEMLRSWANYLGSRLSLIHMMPEHQWDRTAYRKYACRSSNPTQSITKQTLVTTAFDPSSMQVLSHQISGKRTLVCKAIEIPQKVLESDAEQRSELASPTLRAPIDEDEMSATLWHRFSRFATEPAQMLARSMAAAPILLPLVRLLQRDLVPDSNRSHFAEIFYSGIVKRVSDAKKDTDPETIEYDFLPGIRERLLALSSSQRLSDVWEISHEYCTSRFGSSFDAIIENSLSPQEFSVYPSNKEIDPFIRTTREVVQLIRGGRKIPTMVQDTLEMNQSVAANAAPALSPDRIDQLQRDYELLAVQLEDGSNLEKGIPFRERITRTLPAYDPTKVGNTKGWRQTFQKLREQFSDLQSFGVSLSCVQSHNPIVQEADDLAAALENGKRSFRGCYGLRTEFAQLFLKSAPNRLDLKFRDVTGKNIETSAGEPMHFRLGLSRMYLLNRTSTSEELPTDEPAKEQLLHLCRESALALKKLPSTVAKKLWARWPHGFAEKEFYKDSLWYDALLEVFTNRQLTQGGIDRFAIFSDATDNLKRLQFQGPELFPRMTQEVPFDVFCRIPNQLGYPSDVRADLSDLVRSSIEAIDILLGNNNVKESLTVFVLYAEDSPEHIEAVTGFTIALQRWGINAVVNTIHMSSSDDYLSWTANWSSVAKVIVVVISERLYEMDLHHRSSEDRVTMYPETMTLYSLLETHSDRIIPVVLEGKDRRWIPEPLREYRCLLASMGKVSQKNVAEIAREIRRIEKQVKIRKSRVIISYSHDTPEHSQRVLQLAQQLRNDGIDCRIDQFETKPNEGWPLWMKRQVEQADFVLIVFSERYFRRARGEELPSIVERSLWESVLIRNETYFPDLNSKVVPVVLKQEDEKWIFQPLQDLIRYCLTDLTLDVPSGYQALYRRITDARDARVPPLVEQLPGLGPLHSKRKVFLSFSHSDNWYRMELRKVLKADPRIANVYWDDHEIAPGSNWQNVTLKALAESRIMIMLVSPRYLDSKTCQAWAYEIPYALNALSQNTISLLWVASRSIDGADNPFSGIQACSSPSKPLNKLSLQERHAIYQKIKVEVLKQLDLPIDDPEAAVVSIVDQKTETEKMTSPNSLSTIDFLIVSPLAEERNALLSRLPGHYKVPPVENDTNTYFAASLNTERGGETYSIVVLPLVGMGNTNAASAASNAILRWKPRYVLVVGIAGGVEKNGVAIGDVLISDQIADYELQKIENGKSFVRWQVHRADMRLLAAATNHLNLGWRDVVAKRFDENASEVHVGPICTGNKVIADKSLMNEYRDVWTKMIGVEMEGGGVANAVWQSSGQIGMLMIRGVSDLADGKKNTQNTKRWRPYACEIAASWTIDFLRSGPVPSASSTSAFVPKSPPANVTPKANKEREEIEAAELLRLLTCLSELPGAMFSEVLFRMTHEHKLKAGAVAGAASPQTERAVQLLDVAKAQKNMEGLYAILQEMNVFSPSTLPFDPANTSESSTQVDVLIAANKFSWDDSGNRFAIALSFPSEHRKFVLSVANELAKEVGRDRVFYDEWYEVKLVGVAGDLKLQLVFENAEMVVPFFSQHYSKPWCEMEWETIRGILLERRKDDCVIPVAMDDTKIPGWSKVNFAIRRKNRTPKMIAALIAAAYRDRVLQHSMVAVDAIDSKPVPTPVNALVQPVWGLVFERLLWHVFREGAKPGISPLPIPETDAVDSKLIEIVNQDRLSVLDWSTLFFRSLETSINAIPTWIGALALKALAGKQNNLICEYIASDPTRFDSHRNEAFWPKFEKLFPADPSIPTSERKVLLSLLLCTGSLASGKSIGSLEADPNYASLCIPLLDFQHQVRLLATLPKKFESRIQFSRIVFEVFEARVTISKQARTDVFETLRRFGFVHHSDRVDRNGDCDLFLTQRWSNDSQPPLSLGELLG